MTTALAMVLMAVACESPAASTAGSPVTIHHLEWQPTRTQVIEGLAPAFEAQTAAAGRPILVRLEALDLADEAFRAELTARHEAGRGPDVTSFPTAWVPDLATAGHLLELTDRVEAWADWDAHVYPVLRERARDDDGRTHGVPRGATVIQLFYRRDVLEQFGIETAQPRTWDELVDRMTELRAAMDLPPILVPAGTNWAGGTFDEGFINLFLGTGSELYDVDSERWIVRSPGLSAVFGLYATLVDEELLPVAPLLEPNPWEPTKYHTFVEGDLAVVTQGTWGWTFDWGPNGQRPIPQLEERVDTWAFPALGAGEPFVWAAEGWTWTIGGASSHPDAAWSWIQWLSAGEPLARDLVAVGQVSPRDDIQGVAPYAGQPILLEEERLLAIGRSFRPQPGFDAVRRAVAEATEGIIRGELDGPGAAERFAELVTAALGDDAVRDAEEPPE